MVDSVKLLGINSVVVFTSLKNVSTQTTERGVCWSTATNPTVQTNKKTNAEAGLVFSDTVAGLQTSTPYYIKSYVTIEGNITYSAEVTINTKNISVDFDKIYEGNGDSPYIIDVVGNEAMGFLVCSQVSKAIGSTRYTRLTKLDANGNLIWTRDYDDGTWKEPFLIKQLSDGYIIGLHYYQIGDIRVVLRKFDLDGNFVWERQFKKDAIQYFMRLLVRDNDFLVTMKTLNEASSSDPAFRISLWDFIVDKNGNINSELEYPNFIVLAKSSSWYHAIETPDNGFVGYCDSLSNVGGGDNDLEVERFGTQNALKWKKIFGSPTTFEFVVKGVASSDGNYVISGIRYNESKNMSRAWIIKVNGENGGMIWERYYGDENANSFTSIQDLIQYKRAYYATGVTKGSSIYIVKLNSSGNKDWEYFIPAQNGYNLVTPRILNVSDNQNIYLFGIKSKNQSNPGNVFMMKLKE